MTGTVAANDRVRPMTREDLARVLEWRNHPGVRQFMFTQHAISADEHAAWFQRNEHNDERRLLIFESEGAPMGFTNLSQADSAGDWDWGFYVAPTAPKGTGRKLGRAVLNFAFSQLQLKKLCARVLVENERSIRFHHALGFQQENLLRREHFDGSKYHDVVCFGLTREAWLSEGGAQ